MVVTTEEAVYINSDEGPIRPSVAGGSGSRENTRKGELWLKIFTGEESLYQVKGLMGHRSSEDENRSSCR